MVRLILALIFTLSYTAPAHAQDLPVQCSPTGFFNVLSKILPKNTSTLEPDNYLKFLRELRFSSLYAINADLNASGIVTSILGKGCLLLSWQRLPSPCRDYPPGAGVGDG